MQESVTVMKRDAPPFGFTRETWMVWMLYCEVRGIDPVKEWERIVTDLMNQLEESPIRE